MAANQSVKLRKGDTVKVMTGDLKGVTGKVLQVLPAKQAVLVEGIGARKRHIKPNQLNPRGGTKDIHVPIAISKVALVVEGTDKVSRVGFTTKKDGGKVRVARQMKNKEIK
jgi:large subunit ribosomal protein L24